MRKLIICLLVLLGLSLKAFSAGCAVSIFPFSASIDTSNLASGAGSNFNTSIILATIPIDMVGSTHTSQAQGTWTVTVRYTGPSNLPPSETIPLQVTSTGTSSSSGAGLLQAPSAHLVRQIKLFIPVGATLKAYKPEQL